MRTLIFFLQKAIITFMRCPTYDFIKLFFFTQGFLRGDFLFKMRKGEKRVVWCSMPQNNHKLLSNMEGM